MVINRDIFTLFTFMFAALSLLFTVVATTVEYWIVYTFYGIRCAYGFWKYCLGIYWKRHCFQNPSTQDNKHLRFTVAAIVIGKGCKK